MSPWRYRCPEGHACIRIDATVFQCRSCGRSYDKDRLQDLAADGPAQVFTGP